MSRYTDCLTVIFGNEGGVSNNPLDKGGLTNMGVTQAAYDSWRLKHKLPQQPVTMCTTDEATQLYQEDYWTPAQCDSWPQPLDLNMFDTSVNSGPGRALKLLQRALGVAQDGVIGPKTQAALAAVTPREATIKFCDVREAYFREIVAGNPSQATFLNGWLNRVAHMRTLSGVI